MGKSTNILFSLFPIIANKLVFSYFWCLSIIINTGAIFMNNENEVCKILWTGGWDSTYRIVELFREQIQIQPIYCCDPSRGSIQREIETMENIRNTLLEKIEVGGYIRKYFAYKICSA